MENDGMRRFGIILAFWLSTAAGVATASVFSLTDGTTISGHPVSITEDGVQFKQDDEIILPRTGWDKLTPAALRELMAGAKTPHDKELIQPFLDYQPQAEPLRKQIVVKPIAPPSRPAHSLGVFALFASPLGLCILLVLYGANLLAAYEVARYRHQPLATVCGLAAIPVFGVISPIAFLAMPGKPRSEEPADAPQAAPQEEAPAPAAPEPGDAPQAPPPSRPSAAEERKPISMPGARAEAAPDAAAQTAADFPEPIVFARGEYLFNRRFFETKFAGFFRIIPSEAEKNLVLVIKSARGQFVGRRITRATQSELYLQVFKNEATADEMIPFTDILEVQIRHKDTV